MGAEQLQTCLRLMLVSCQQNVKVQLLANPVGLVFSSGREQFPGLQITFKTAVIDTDCQIYPGLFQLIQGCGSGRKCFLDRNAR